jgi:uncharacterized protein (TIGR01244 family)
MEIRRITDNYAVSPQITPADLPVIAQAGFTTVLCNRPNEEVPVELQSDVMRIATEAAGLTFVELPLVHSTIEDCVAQQMDIIGQSSGPVFAYCASGTRCSVIWSLGQVGQLPTDDIIDATAKVGYDLAGLRPRLEELAKG